MRLAPTTKSNHLGFRFERSAVNSKPAEIHALLKDDLGFTLGALKQHPKVYWIWNHRRWCLEHIPIEGDANSEAEGVGDRDGLDWQRQTWARELFVVEKMLDVDPRNCGCLHFLHPLLYLRRNCILIPLEAVHAWNYRRYVLASLPPDPPGTGNSSSKTSPPSLHRTPATELAFTTKKIEANFSNFSAWHQRSKVYAVTGQISDTSVRDAG